MLLDFWSSKSLSYRLAKRDISAQYRQSVLGYFWAFLLPLVTTLVWLFLQGSGIVKLDNTGVPYSVYVFSGTIFWQIFTEAFQSPIQQVTLGKSLLSKLNFPRESIIFSGILKVMFNAGIKMIVLIPVILYLLPSFHLSIFLLPLGIISLILAGTSLGWCLAPISTLYNDIGKGIPILMQFLMFFSPVVFAIPESGIPNLIFRYNLTTPILTTCRGWLTGTNTEYLSEFILVNACLLLLFMVAWVVYRITMPVLIERMSN
jgi:lipopolysaccharide transport system permease protein